MTAFQEALSQYTIPTGSPRTVLHVGCGPDEILRLHEVFRTPDWHEVRVDIDPQVKPSLIGSITHLPVAGNAVDALWSSHTLEHLYHHDVQLAIAEFFRVLKPGGFLLITMPDLQRVAEFVAANRLTDVVYESPGGPITPLDMIYGHRASIAYGNRFMAHRTGFTAKSLALALLQAGFGTMKVDRDRRAFSLWACAEKRPRSGKGG